MTSKPFDLNQKMRDLEHIEEYFQRPDMDLAEAIKRHKEALQLGKEIVTYLEEAESIVQELDTFLMVKAVSEESL